MYGIIEKKMIIYIKRGNIFKIDNVNNFAHGCNCAGAMGKGIALQFRKRFPLMYTQYKNLCASGDFQLGDVFLYQFNEGFVFNLATQYSWKTKADENAIRTSLTKMLDIACEYNIKQIAFPKIGAGLGGLDWLEVKLIIEDIASKYNDINLFVVEDFDGDV